MERTELEGFTDQTFPIDFDATARVSEAVRELRKEYPGQELVEFGLKRKVPGESDPSKRTKLVTPIPGEDSIKVMAQNGSIDKLTVPVLVEVIKRFGGKIGSKKKADLIDQICTFILNKINQ